MNRLRTVSDRERQLASHLRQHVLLLIEQRAWSYEEVAQRLDMLPSGVEMFIGSPSWSFDVAVRAALALGIDVDVRASGS